MCLYKINIFYINGEIINKRYYKWIVRILYGLFGKVVLLITSSNNVTMIAHIISTMDESSKLLIRRGCKKTQFH